MKRFLLQTFTVYPGVLVTIYVSVGVFLTFWENAGQIHKFDKHKKEIFQDFL